MREAASPNPKTSNGVRKRGSPKYTIAVISASES